MKGGLSACGLGALLLLVSCRSSAPQAVDSAPPPAAPATVWTWHPLGGLAVVEGEVSEPTDLILEGPSIRERRFAEPGPVRWEFYRPPEGETAVLRTAQGRELGRFTFRLPPPVPAPAEAMRPPRPIPSPAPEREPAPTARAQARLRTLPVTPIPTRKPQALPQPSLPLPQASAPEQHPLPSPRSASASRPTSAPWPGAGEALNLTRGPGGHRRILLSFDGGSSAEVAPEVLDLLKARSIRTTLFLTGTFIRRYPDLVRRMAAEGHEIGNHTMNHPHFAPGMKRDPAWTRERVQRELLEADRTLVQLLGRPMDPYWRAPYGEHTAEIRRWAEELGYRHVGWSEGADTLDWATPKQQRLYRSGEAIVQRLRQRLDRDGDGLIVLMHLGSERIQGDRPTEGLGAYLDRALAGGWTFVSAGDFLRDLGKPAWDPMPRLALLSPSAR